LNKRPPPPDDARQHWLRELQLLDGAPDTALDRFARMAARTSASPIGLVTFLAADHQAVAGMHGWRRRTTTLLESFCRHTLGSAAATCIEDAAADPRTRDNPLVTGAERVRFYVGHPVVFRGCALGAVCVLDSRPRPAHEVDVDALGDIAASVADLLELRHQRRLIAAEQQGQRELAEALARAERSRLDSEHRYRLLWETTTDAVLVIDADSRILLANPAVQAMFGHAPEALVGQPLSVLQPPPLAAAHLAGMGRYLATGQRTLNWRATRTSALRSDGSEFPVEIAFSELESGTVRLFAAFMRDITQQRREEQARLELQDRLQQGQKMEAIGVLAGGVAHDFNNMVAGILANVALAEQDIVLGQPVGDRLAQIRIAGVRARDMVAKLLAFARRQPVRLVACQVQPLVHEALALLRATLPAGARLQSELADEPLWVRADPTQFEQVLINLCTNAWQALDGRAGCIRVGARLEAQAAPQADAPRVHVFVADDGPGIDPAARERIFEPFFTTKPSGVGTGLGLAVVHGIVAAHDGHIAVDSAPGAGCTVHLWLPAIGADAAADAAAEAPVLAAGAGGHIVLVDDDEVITTVAAELLRRAGYRVSVFNDPRAALAQLRRQPGEVDLLVTDLNMPEMSGLELRQLVRAVRPRLPVIISSGNLPDPETEGSAPEDGPTFRKQYLVEELLPLVAQQLASPTWPGPSQKA
jgi:two-component system cell cycle sensor histidine kinase/response regulator CckA